MASSSTQIVKYHVFPSFHGPDVRRKFLSHLYYHFASKGITTFKDQGIKRGQTIGPELKKAIRESRIAIVVLSKNYASSSWCLDELDEILKCKEAWGQIVMTIFYDVDPSNVRKQIGDFGRAFEKTCERKIEEEKLRWSKALTSVANIKGEHSLHWDEEAAMVERIATDVSNKLNGTASRDFEDMVGLQVHVAKVNTLLRLESDEVKMIGISGPAGIGKTTIARALFNQLSTEFQFKCFMGNLKGNYKGIGVDDYDSKFYLQNQLLSKILNQKDVRIHHLGAVKEWLQDKRVLIVIDDVEDKEQLDALAKEHSWFGSGSRIIVTTRDKRVVQPYCSNIYYHVDYPSKREALEILCMSAFKQSSPKKGFEELAVKVAKLCGNLPLCLSVVGSSLRGESNHEWKLQLNRLETSLDRKIEDVLKVAYEKLSKKEQVLFLHIACFFNHLHRGKLTNFLADSNLDVRNGLEILADISIFYISTVGNVVMHPLVQQLGRHIVLKQSDEPAKRQFLMEAQEIYDVLANETGTGSVLGISFDLSKIKECSISGRAFEGMRNLRFLRICCKLFSKEVTLRIQGDLKYLPRLRLLHWNSYPGKRLPPTFRPECLVALIMPCSKLEKLWRGIEPLANLKEIDLSFSEKLKEIPNLSNATNLDTLTLRYCISLVELPSSIGNLHKLRALMMLGCKRLKVVPTNINLASLEKVDMYLCSQLRMFPDISKKIKYLYLGNSKIKEVPPSVVKDWSRLEEFCINGSNLKRLTLVPSTVTYLDLSFNDMEKIPDCVIKLQLRTLRVQHCRNLVSLPNLSRSLEYLYANNCGSLERVSSFHDPVTVLMFHNCLKLDENARREIIQQRVIRYVLLPGKEVPAEFTHRARGNSITIPIAPGGEETFSASSIFKACLLLSPVEGNSNFDISCRLKSTGGDLLNKFHRRVVIPSQQKIETKHLFIFYDDLFQENICLDVITNEIVFEFGCGGKYKIDECGVQILMKEAESSSSSKDEFFEILGNNNHNTAGEDYGAEVVKFSQDEYIKNSWGWLRKLGLGKKMKKKTEAAL